MPSAAPQRQHRPPVQSISTVRALLTALRPQTPEDYAGAGNQVIERAAVNAATTTNATWASPLAAQPFDAGRVGSFRERALVSRIGLREVPLNSRLTDVTARPTASWIPEGGLKPLARATLASSTMPPRKCMASFIVTNELLRMGDAAASTALRRLLTDSVAKLLDDSLLDAVAGSAARPPGLRFGVAATSSPAGSVSGLAAMIEAMLARGVNVEDLVFLTSPVTLRTIATLDPRTAASGQVLGVRTEMAPLASNLVMLVDTNSTVFGLGVPEARTSTEAIVEADDAPSGSGAKTSLWQANLACVMSEVYAAWFSPAGGISWTTLS